MFNNIAKSHDAHRFQGVKKESQEIAKQRCGDCPYRAAAAAIGAEETRQDRENYASKPSTTIL